MASLTSCSGPRIACSGRAADPSKNSAKASEGSVAEGICSTASSRYFRQPFAQSFFRGAVSERTPKERRKKKKKGEKNIKTGLPKSKLKVGWPDQRKKEKKKQTFSGAPIPCGPFKGYFAILNAIEEQSSSPRLKGLLRARHRHIFRRRSKSAAHGFSKPALTHREDAENRGSQIRIRPNYDSDFELKAKRKKQTG